MTDIGNYQNKLERIPDIPQTGYIRVMSKIVKDLSSGIYSSPANCIKEIINNAFDADAQKVIIRARPTLNLFSITDDGIGMSLEDFQEKFSVISKSYKRINSEFSEKYKRPLIGKIGIGFIAVSEICDKLIVISKRKGDIGKFKAEIDFKKFKDSENIESNDEFYVKSSYDLVYEEVPDEVNESYTKIILSELTTDFRNVIQDKDNIVLNNPISDEFDDKYFEEIIDYISNKRIKTYDELGEYWKLVFDIAQTVPVEYLENGPVKLNKKDPIIESIKNDLKSYNFRVDFDGLNLKKTICFPNQDKFEEIESYIVHTFKEEINVEGDILAFRGYLYSQHGSIYPREDNGVLIRIKNTKVGEVDNSFLGYPFSTNQVFRSWVFGEIYVDEGLEDAMNIDRYSFRITHKHYRELRKFVHRYIHEIIFPHCLDNYYLKQKKRSSSVI